MHLARKYHFKEVISSPRRDSATKIEMFERLKDTIMGLFESDDMF